LAPSRLECSTNVVGRPGLSVTTNGEDAQFASVPLDTVRVSPRVTFAIDGIALTPQDRNFQGT
jgi:hypothetical protein